MSIIDIIRFILGTIFLASGLIIFIIEILSARFIAAQNGSILLISNCVKSFTKDSLESKLVTIKVEGGKGGHSGLVNEGSYDPFCVLARFAQAIIDSNKTIQLHSLSTTDELKNAVPEDATITFISSATEDEIKQIIKPVFEQFQAEYPAEKNMSYSVSVAASSTNKVISQEDSEHLVEFMNSVWYGPFSYFPNGALEASANISPFWLDLDKTWDDSDKTTAQFYVYQLARYNTYSKDDVFKLMGTYSQQILKSYFSDRAFDLDDLYEEDAGYPVWYKAGENPLIEISRKAIRRQGIEPSYPIGHGGTECSFFCVPDQNPNINQLNWGPDTVDEHTVRETLYLDSYQRFIQEIIDILHSMNF